MSRQRSTSFGGERKRPVSLFEPAVSGLSHQETDGERDENDSTETLDSTGKPGGCMGQLRRFDNLDDLNNLMLHRPEKSDLIAKNILKADNIAPALAAAQAELKKKKLEDALNNRLAHRSAADELKEHNILKNTNISASLAAQQEELKKRILEDSLNSKLANRSAPEDVKARLAI